MVPSTNFNLFKSKKTGILLKNMNFCYNMRPIQAYSRWLGLTSYSINYKSNGDIHEVRVKAFDILRFIASICIYLFSSCVYVKLVEFPQVQNASYVLILLDSVTMSCGLSFCAIAVVMDMLNRHRMADILKKIMIFDKKVGESIFY